MCFNVQSILRPPHHSGLLHRLHVKTKKLNPMVTSCFAHSHVASGEIPQPPTFIHRSSLVSASILALQRFFSLLRIMLVLLRFPSQQSLPFLPTSWTSLRARTQLSHILILIPPSVELRFLIISSGIKNIPSVPFLFPVPITRRTCFLQIYTNLSWVLN